MEFRILGPMEVLDGTRRVALPAGRGRALLALLVLHAGDEVPAERLIDELWGEHPPATAGTVVQGLVSRLRRALEPARAKGEEATVLQTIGNGYRLAVDRGAVDADRFKHLLDAARGAMPGVRSALLAEALMLWRGPALADFVYEPFAQRPISALDELRLLATEDRIENDLELGKDQELISEIEQLIAEHPYRERLRGLLMVAYYRGGRQADALNAYQAAREALLNELGVEPGPDLRELQAAILRQDPSLELARLRRTADAPATAHDGWLPRERRTITVVSLDLSASADEGSDPELLDRIGNRSRAIASEVLTRNGARVEHVVGDLLLGFIGFPVAHDDDAVRAVRAALELRSQLEALQREEQPGQAEFSMRAGIDTGDIVVGGSGGSLRDMIAGHAVTSAYRLQLVADAGDVVVGPGTQRLVRGAVVLKPASDGVGASGAWRVLDVVTAATGPVRSFEGAMIGRQDELTRLRTAFRLAVRSASVVRCLVLGEAGIGKSRLVKDFVDSIAGEARVLTGRGAAYAADPALMALRQIVLEAAGAAGWPSLSELIGAEDVTQIAATVGITTGAGNVHGLYAAVGRLLEALAVRSPLVLVFEDLHWAEPALLDVVDYLAHAGRGRVLLVCVARPDLIERRHEWESEDVLILDPLPPQDIEELVLVRGGPIASGTVEHIVASAQGNPLYAEQLLAAHQDLALDPGPTSLQGLLTNRLDRVGPGERDLLRCASVIGEECDRETLAALLPEDAVPFVERHVETLERKQLVARTGEGRFLFGHVLIRAAVYQSMTRQDRARLHERYADWLEHDPIRLGAEADEVIGYHPDWLSWYERVGGLTRRTSSPP
jgi:DNA-binding SARP family transcriptional activator